MRPRDPDNDPRYLALLQLLETAEGIWKASRLFFARWDISPSQFNVLNLLRIHPDGLSQTELSEYLLMHRSNITGLVDQLEKAGLAERRDVAGDRRAYRILLTPAGGKLLQEILPGYYEGALRIWSAVPERRVAQIASALTELHHGVEVVAAQLKAAETGEKPAARKNRAETPGKRVGTPEARVGPAPPEPKRPRTARLKRTKRTG